MKNDIRIILLRIAGMGGMERYIDLRTKDLGDELGISQQSASIYLRDLEDDGFIERIRKKSGGKVRITTSGIDLLRGLHEELNGLFHNRRAIHLRGRIDEGLGEGAYYLSQEGYIEQIMETFGFKPYPGTLNISLDGEFSPSIDLLRRGPGIEIREFYSAGRTFGSCLCYPCTVEGQEAVIMVPERTIHKNILEIIANKRLRDQMEDLVNIELQFPAYLDGP